MVQRWGSLTICQPGSWKVVLEVDPWLTFERSSHDATFVWWFGLWSWPGLALEAVGGDGYRSVAGHMRGLE